MSKQCLRCEYDLTGLPEEYVCPECGLAYDPYNVVLELRATGRRVEAIVSLLICTWVIVSMLLRGTLGREGWLLVAVLGGMLLAELYRAFILRNPHRRLILNRSGVHLVRGVSDGETFEWTCVDSAKWSWVTGALIVRDATGRKLFSISSREQSSGRRGRRCAREINRLKKVYSGEVSGE